MSNYTVWPKRDPLKNCFIVPNEIFCLKLSAQAIAIYAYLLYIENRHTYRCHVSYNSIGESVGMSKNTVRKYVQELEEHHLIRTEPTIIDHNGEPRNGALIYHILPIQGAVDAFHERQREPQHTAPA